MKENKLYDEEGGKENYLTKEVKRGKQRKEIKKKELKGGTDKIRRGREAENRRRRGREGGRG